jgi:hypothetical protein
MARPYQTESEDRREDAWLDSIESGASTTLDIATVTGLTRRRVQQRVAAARRRRDEAAAVAVAVDRPHDPADLPYVPLVSGPSRGLHYRLDVDQLSRLPDCPFRINTAAGRWQKIEHRDNRGGEKPAEAKESRHRFRPKNPKRNREVG